MRAPVKPRRAYDSSRRREQARATRRAVLDAARALFLERGYAATTIDAIAAAASVSPETVYSVFGSKRALLAQLVDVAIAGDPDAPPVVDQAWVEQMREEPDPRARLAILARNGAAILARRSDVDEIVRGAAMADPEIAALWQRGRTERRAGQRELLRIAAGDRGLRRDLDLDTAADILFAIGSPEVFRLLVADRAWGAGQFERWYAATLDRLLLEDAALAT